MFDVGRSMFDVHYFLFPIKLDALLSNGRADTSYETSSHTERSEITEVWVYSRLRRKKNVLCGLCEL
jgi:hypothetical protein